MNAVDLSKTPETESPEKSAIVKAAENMGLPYLVPRIQITQVVNAFFPSEPNDPVFKGKINNLIGRFGAGYIAIAKEHYGHDKVRTAAEIQGILNASQLETGNPPDGSFTPADEMPTEDRLYGDTGEDKVSFQGHFKTFAGPAWELPEEQVFEELGIIETYPVMQVLNRKFYLCGEPQDLPRKEIKKLDKEMQELNRQHVKAVMKLMTSFIGKKNIVPERKVKAALRKARKAAKAKG